MKTYASMLAIGLAWFVSPLAAVSQTETEAQARAGGEGDATEAAVRFQRAVELYREGSYEGALAEFRKAYQLSPSYRVLYNIAQAQYALHDFVGAYRSLVQYMAEGKGDIATDRRMQVDEMFARLRERIGQIEISTNVDGAEIRVDDVAVGTSPLPGPIAVNVGTRKVSALKEGSPEVVRVVTVAGTENLKIDLRMEEPMIRRSSPMVGGVFRSAPVVVRSQGPAEPSRAPLIVSLSATAAFAVATGVFGFLAVDAQRELNDQLGTYPNTRDRIENARAKSKNYAYITDAFGAATVVSGGVALYLALTHWGDSSKPRSRKTSRAIVIAPTVGGMVMEGSF
jgi:hypothetical protein